MKRLFPVRPGRHSLFLAVPALLAALLVGCAPVWAKQSASPPNLKPTQVQITVPKQIVTLVPGTSYEAVAHIINLDTTPTPLLMYGVKITDTPSGAIGLLPNRQWITLSTNRMTVPARSAKGFTFAIHVPKNIRSGVYVYGIAAQYSPGHSLIHKGRVNLNVQVNVRSVALIAVAIPGAKYKAGLKAHGLTEARINPYQYGFTSNIANPGNVYEYVTSTLILQNGKHRTRFPGANVLLLAFGSSEVQFQAPLIDVGKRTIAYVVFHSIYGGTTLSAHLHVMPYKAPKPKKQP